MVQIKKISFNIFALVITLSQFQMLFSEINFSINIDGSVEINEINNIMNVKKIKKSCDITCFNALLIKGTIKNLYVFIFIIF